MADETTLTLRSIDSLLCERFVIPSYQRGYRWTDRQVIELLDDLEEFRRAVTSGGRNGTQDSFYCLQPVVVRPTADGAWEVIDGQQRLTTLWLLMRALEKMMGVLEKTPYTLAYHTRPQSAAFLTSLDVNASEDNVDFHHLYKAFTTIQAWLAGREGTGKLALLQRLLDPDQRNVRVIWYQLAPSEDPIQVFIRLNVGKIPLTNAELIRALFLKRRDGLDQPPLHARLRIAHEWDAIEKRLQDDTFWHFVHHGPSPFPARIEYLFAAHVHAEKLQVHPHDDYATFIAYQKHFLGTHRDEAESVAQSAASGLPRRVDHHWADIRQIAQRLEEWYEDRRLYHLVGYLIATTRASGQDELVGLIAKRKVTTSGRFDASLRATMFQRLFKATLAQKDADSVRAIIAPRLDDLTYETPSQHNDIRAVLLLFNIATLLRNPTSTLRFPFDLYALQPWDIEHIRSVKSDMPDRPDHQKEWLTRVIEYWSDDGLDPDPDAQPLLNDAVMLQKTSPFDRAAFLVLYQRILAHFGEDEHLESDHGLSNLALLDAHTNRGYRNAVFPLKRRCILRRDKEGIFVPLCTTNVFLKYYSRNIAQMMTWHREDGAAYLGAIVEMLTHFFVEDPS